MASVLAKSLSRLPRDSIVDLCLKWSQAKSSTPYLSSNRNLLESDEEDYLHEPAENVIALKQIWWDIKEQERENDSLSKRDIVDRIMDGDWRRGLSFQQLADIDFAHLEHNDTALRWTALKLVPFVAAVEEPKVAHTTKKRKLSHPLTEKQFHYPTISPANFVANLKSHIGPLVKAHYTLHRLPAPSSLVVLRLYLVSNTPFAPLSGNIPKSARQATDSGRVMYIALPDSCPYVYVSISGSTSSSLTSRPKGDNAAVRAKIDIAATKRVILESIPKALSKPQERWSLETTKLTCRSLKAISLLRGNGRPGTAGGCYSKFSEEYEWKPTGLSNTRQKVRDDSQREKQAAGLTPLTIPHPVQSALNSESSHDRLISTRFGHITNPSRARLDRFHLTISDLLAPPLTNKQPSPPPPRKRKRRSLEDIEAGRDTPLEPAAKSKTEPAQITLSFSGTDVFRGLRELAALDGGRYVDLDRMPSWITGEKGVSNLVV